MTTPTLSEGDQKKVLDVAERITKAIGKESQIIAAHACLIVIQLSAVLGSNGVIKNIESGE